MKRRGKYLGQIWDKKKQKPVEKGEFFSDIIHGLSYWYSCNTPIYRLLAINYLSILEGSCSIQLSYWRILAYTLKNEESFQKRLVCCGCFFFFFAGGLTIFLTLLYNHSGKMTRIPSVWTSGMRDSRSHFAFERTTIRYIPFPIGTAFILAPFDQ